MKKFVAFVLVMAMAVVANAGLMITNDGNTIGVSSKGPGFILTTAKFETELELDWSGFTVPATYEYVPGVGLPWGGAPAVLDAAQGLFTAYTSNAVKPAGPIAIFTGVALPKGWVITDDDTQTPINLVADTLNVDGQVTSGLIDTVYAVPEPMTMSLLGLGGLAAIRRRRA